MGGGQSIQMACHDPQVKGRMASVNQQLKHRPLFAARSGTRVTRCYLAGESTVVAQYGIVIFRLRAEAFPEKLALVKQTGFEGPKPVRDRAQNAR
jgi:hypothetical protein